MGSLQLTREQGGALGSVGLLGSGVVCESALCLSCDISAADPERRTHRAEVTHRANGVAREDLVAARAGNTGELGKSVNSEVQTLQTLPEYS